MIMMMMLSLIPSVNICKTLVSGVFALCSNTARHLIDDGVVRDTDYDNECGVDDNDGVGGRNDQ